MIYQNYSLLICWHGLGKIRKLLKFIFRGLFKLKKKYTWWKIYFLIHPTTLITTNQLSKTLVCCWQALQSVTLNYSPTTLALWYHTFTLKWGLLQDQFWSRVPDSCQHQNLNSVDFIWDRWSLQLHSIKPISFSNYNNPSWKLDCIIFKWLNVYITII